VNNLAMPDDSKSSAGDLGAASENRLVLASASPRRRELLSILGIPFDIIPPETDESPRSEEPPRDFVVRAARDKGDEVAGRVSNAVVLSADTIVSLRGEIFGKPKEPADAVRMLELLSGEQHWVFTAVSAIDSRSGLRIEGLEETKVWFRSLDRAFIEDYMKRENVMDKAGAYAVQGFAAVFVSRIEGNYTNVMGLPLPLTYDLVTRHGLKCSTS
jgi:septum formation protein